MRIGLGEYERTKYGRRCSVEAQMYFFRLLLRSEPEVASSLYGEPYKYYKPFHEAAERAGWEFGLWWRLISSDRDFQIFDKKQRVLFVSLKQELGGLRKALLKWAKCWNLKEHWCLDEALRALEAKSVTEFYQKKWATAEEEARNWFFSNNIMKNVLVDKRLDFFSDSDDLDSYAMFSPNQFPNSEIHKNSYPYLDPPYSLPIWLPPLQYRKNYLKAVRILAAKMYDHAIEHLTTPVESINRQIPWLSLAPPLLGDAQQESVVNSIVSVAEQYCVEVEKYYDSLKGWRKSSRRPKLRSHMIWTARVRTHCHSPSEATKVFDEIAEEEGLEVSAIKKAVREMLDDLGLRLKPTFKSSKGESARSADGNSC